MRSLPSSLPDNLEEDYFRSIRAQAHINTQRYFRENSRSVNPRSAEYELKFQNVLASIMYRRMLSHSDSTPNLLIAPPPPNTIAPPPPLAQHREYPTLLVVCSAIALLFTVSKCFLDKKQAVALQILFMSAMYHYSNQGRLR